MEFDGASEQTSSGIGAAACGVTQAGTDGGDWSGPVGAVADDPAGDVGEEEAQRGGRVMRGKKPGRGSL